MSAKSPKKRQSKTPSVPPPRSASVSAPLMAAGASDTLAPAQAAENPRLPLVRNLVVVAVWLYVAALWLLALDQTFDWGIFGAKTATVP